MALAASPDGRTLVTDLLGSLWTVPAQGGAARRITDERLEARRPAFSPRAIASCSRATSTMAGISGASPPMARGQGTHLGRIRRPRAALVARRAPGWRSRPTARPITTSGSSTRAAAICVRSRKTPIRTPSPPGRVMIAKSCSCRLDRRQAYAPSTNTQAPPAQGSTIWAVNVETGAERFVGAAQGRVSGPVWTPDGKQVMYNVIADGTSRLEIGGKPVVTGEDVFPFPAQWVSGTDYSYTSDGKIRKRALGADKAQTIEFTATVAIQRPQYTKKQRNFTSTEPRPARGIIRPSVSPDGKRVAFAALGDMWLMTIGSAPDAHHERSVSRCRSRMVTGRLGTRVLVRPRR